MVSGHCEQSFKWGLYLRADLHRYLLEVERTLQNQVEVAVDILNDTGPNVFALRIAQRTIRLAPIASADLNERFVAIKVAQIFWHFDVHVVDYVRAVRYDRVDVVPVEVAID